MRQPALLMPYGLWLSEHRLGLRNERCVAIGDLGTGRHSVKLRPGLAASTQPGKRHGPKRHRAVPTGRVAVRRRLQRRIQRRKGSFVVRQPVPGDADRGRKARVVRPLLVRGLSEDQAHARRPLHFR